ncbi:MAG: glycosyltransferase [Thermodesulfobacteriota bacterium]
MKIDLHVHSKFSKRPSQWILQKIGCPESFTDPLYLYGVMKKRGFSAITMTDHNTIDGCLEIAHLPGVFISEEVTTYFPEDRCKVHVLVYDIDDSIHQDIQKIRENIFDLTAYLNRHQIVHALAHPLYSINEKLTLDHFEKFLLLFQTFELNGAREDVQNQIIRAIVKKLTPRDIEEMIEKHGIEPKPGLDWRKGLIGGSDDHSALNMGRSYTEVEEAKNIKEFLGALGTERCRPKGRGASPLTLSHNIYGIAYQYFNGRFHLDKYTNKDVLIRFLDRFLQPEQGGRSWFPLKYTSLLTQRRHQRLAHSGNVQDVIRHEGERIIMGNPDLSAIIENGYHDQGDCDEQWFKFVNQVCNKVLGRFGEEIFRSLSGLNVFSVFSFIGAAGSLYTLMAPYFVSFGLFARDRRLANQILWRFTKNHAPTGKTPIKIAHFTDTYYEVNGVARTLRQQVELATQMGKNLTIITCDAHQPEHMGRVYNFKPIDVFELPEYPEQKLFLPPFLEILRHVYENEYNYIHAATPGPIGLAALAVARILKLPISGTYHTALPQYAARLTGDEGLEQLLWRYTLWFYDQMQGIYVPSQDTGQELISKGINAEKIFVYPRGVDSEIFNPKQRNGFYLRRYDLGEVTKLLYVGRISKEKNMPLLARAFKEIAACSNNVHLILVGDGPYLETMKSELAGYPCTFTGYLHGQELSEAYASADIFVFPSTTDTFGNVILEAQASGLPVIVTDAGGPRENIIAGQTGLIIPGDDEKSLVASVLALVENPEDWARMSQAARRYAESRSFEKAFLEHWKMYSRERDMTGSRTVKFPTGNDLFDAGGLGG